MMMIYKLPFVDKRVGVQIKLRDSSTTRAIPKRFCDEIPDEKALHQVSFTFTFCFWV